MTDFNLPSIFVPLVGLVFPAIAMASSTSRGLGDVYKRQQQLQWLLYLFMFKKTRLFRPDRTKFHQFISTLGLGS